MSPRSSLFRNVVANYLGPLLNGVINLVLVALLVRQLGVVSYGVWVLSLTLFTTVSLLDLGLGTAAVKYVAEFVARQNRTALERTTRGYLGLATALGAAMGLFFLVAARPLAIFFKVPASVLATAVAVLRLTGVTFFFAFPQLALSYILQGWQRYDLTNALSVVVSLVRGVLLGVVVLAGGGLISLASVTLVTQVVALLGVVSIYRRAAPEVALRIGWPDREVLGRLLGFGWATFLSDTMTVWIRNVDALLVSRLISVAAVSPYTVAAKVPLALTNWVWAGPGATLPWFAELEARDEREKVQRTFLIGMRLLLLALVPAGSLLVVLAKPLLAVWVGEGFVPHAILLQIFAVVFVSDAMRGLAVMALYGTGRPQSVFWMCALQFIASVVLIFVWAPRFELVGVALAVALPALLTNWFALVPYACRTLQIRAREFFSQALGSHLLPAILFGGLLWLVAGRVPAQLSRVLGAFLAGGMFYLVLYWWLGLDGAERRGVISFAHMRLRGLIAASAPRTPF